MRSKKRAAFCVAKMIEELINGAVEKTKEGVVNVKIKSSYFIVAGMGLMAAVSWNNAVKDGVEYYFPMPQTKAYASVATAIIVTILLVLFVIFLPSYDSELPEGTQRKLLETKMDNMQKQLDTLQQENRKLRSATR